MYTQLLGINQHGQILTSNMKIYLSGDEKHAHVSLKNTSLMNKDNVEPIINKFYLCIFNQNEEDLAVDFQDRGLWNIEYTVQDPNPETKKTKITFTAANDYIGLLPNQTLSFTLINKKPNSHFTENQFSNKTQEQDYQVGVTFIDKTENDVTLEGQFILMPTITTTPPPPIPAPAPTSIPTANPQSFSQIMVEGKTQLVGPSLYDPNEPSLYPITHSSEVVTWIEKAGPNNVIIGGFVRKVIQYKTLDHDGNITQRETTNDIPFHCMIDRDDANEGDLFEVTGSAVISEVYAHPVNFGKDPKFKKPVAWQFMDKLVVKICIRKKFTTL